MHQNIHQNEAAKERCRQKKLEKLLEEKEDANDGAGESRSRRRAAKRAKVRLSEAIQELKSREYGVDIKDDEEVDDDDAAFVAANEADLEGKYEVKKSEDGKKKFHCSLCDFAGDHKTDVESHLLSEHAGYLAGDADDEYNESDES